jgi:hypothetical protein
MTATDTNPTTSATGTPATRNAPGRTVSIVGIVLGALGLIIGIVTGLPGLICGIVGAAQGNRLGWWAIAVSVVCTVAGIAIGLAVIGAHH